MAYRFTQRYNMAPTGEIKVICFLNICHVDISIKRVALFLRTEQEIVLQ